MGDVNRNTLSGGADVSREKMKAATSLCLLSDECSVCTCKEHTTPFKVDVDCSGNKQACKQVLVYPA